MAATYKPTGYAQRTETKPQCLIEILFELEFEHESTTRSGYQGHIVHQRT
jgi:hypothetical protein